MDKILSFLVILTVSCTAMSAAAQDETDVLARGILRVMTGERGTLAWRECGTRLSHEEAEVRAHEYATLLMAEHAADPNFDPWIGGGIAMQESSLNRCALSRDANRVAAISLGHTPTEAEIVRILRNRAFRNSLGLSIFDAGLVQFRWPGPIATLSGLTDPGSLVDAHTSIHMLAVASQRYRSACEETQTYSGTYTVNREGAAPRTHRYSVPCMDGYWVQHNSPSSFNYRYYQNVMRWVRLFHERSVLPS